MGVAALCMALMVAPVQGASFLPGLITMGNKHDKGFYEMAYIGAERFKKEFGTPYLEIQVVNTAQYGQTLRAMARRGANPVLAMAPAMAPAVANVAREFPKVQFILIDANDASGPNVSSLRFREQEGSFLVGMAAAMKSRTHVIGFIGGMELPQIRAFGCGYVQGARYIDPKVRVAQNMAGATEKAFFDPVRGAELARSQFARGVDVVFSAASMTSLGVLQQAKQSGKLAIGVDSNQNGLYPGTMLTSMVKRMDNAVYGALLAMKDGSWKPGVKSLGLKEGAVDWAMDEHNRALITPGMEQRIKQARADIIAGKIRVTDFRTDNSCPVK